MVSYVKSSGSKVLFIAILCSAVFHLFWIATIKIVTKSPVKGPVKFSRVSFLGPISEKGSFDLKAAPKSASFLEKRYRAVVNKTITAQDLKTPVTVYGRSQDARAKDYAGNSAMARLIEETIGTVKPEIDHPVDVE